MYNLTNIFLHFLNKDTQDIFGITDSTDAKTINKICCGINASVLLCEDYCFFPLGFIYESEITRQVINRIEPFLANGLIRVCMKESDINVYLEKKQSQLAGYSSDDIYKPYFSSGIASQMRDIGTIYIGIDNHVGERCINDWIKQSENYIETLTGDMKFAEAVIGNYKDVINIISSLSRAVSNVREERQAFIWKRVDKAIEKVNAKSRGFDKHARNLFERNYYKVYLTDYKAAILYDFYLIDHGVNFGIEPSNYVNYQWFEAFLSAVDLDILLSLPPEQIISVRKSNAFNELIIIYSKICNRKNLTTSEIRHTVAQMLRKNDKQINDYIEQVNEIIGGHKSRKEVKMNANLDDVVDVLIITATLEEEQSIINNIDSSKLISKKTTEGYSYFTYKEGMNFAIVRAIEMREANAAMTGQYYSDELKPKYIAMAGFAAGKINKCQLGDVFIPYKVYKYGDGKRIKDEELPEISSYNLDPLWRQKVERFGESWRKDLEGLVKPKGLEIQEYHFINKLLETDCIAPKKVWSHDELPDLPKIINKQCEEGNIYLDADTIHVTEIGKKKYAEKNLLEYWEEVKDIEPSTVVGVLATGNEVQEWDGIFDFLGKKYDRKTMAIDMEAHAIAALADFNHKPCIIAKGIGDFAQENKAFDNRYIEYSTYSAFRFLINFFNSLEENESQ